MKKIVTIILSALVLSASAQTHYLFGTCYSGGTMNYGTIFRTDLDGSNLQVVHSFQNVDGEKPWGRMAQAPNGNIYGVTYLGGCADSCVLYEYNPYTGTCSDIYDFFCTSPSGEPSQGGIYLSTDGNLYGLEQSGIVYKFDPNTHIYTLLNQTSGISYYGGVMKASDNALYGSSFNGGTHGKGTIFKYDLAANTYSTVYSFDSVHGSSSYFGTLVEATDGKLYGTTSQGGASNFGVLFSYDRALNAYTDLYDFNSVSGVNPFSGLIQATDGKLYGMTGYGGSFDDGTIFSYDIPMAQFTVIHNFNGIDGSQPKYPLYQASNGILYGTTYNVVTSYPGSAFSYDISTNTYTVLANFNGTLGSNPQSDIMEATLLTTGIAEQDGSTFSISPNPATTTLTIQQASNSTIKDVHIYNVLGECVLRKQLSTNNQQTASDISSFKNGMYIIEVTTEQGTIRKRLVKE